MSKTYVELPYYDMYNIPPRDERVILLSSTTLRIRSPTISNVATTRNLYAACTHTDFVQPTGIGQSLLFYRYYMYAGL